MGPHAFAVLAGAREHEMDGHKKKSEPSDKRDDPYCGFRNDKYRFMALVVREICGVGRYIIFLVAAYYCGAPVASPMFAALLAKLAL